MQKIHKENPYKKCEACGVVGHYDIHHIKSRGNLGDDTEENFAYLCHKDHMILHSSPDQFRDDYTEELYSRLMGKNGLR